MSSYIGYTPRVLTDTTNLLSDQIIPIIADEKIYTLNFAPTSDNLLMVSVNGIMYLPTLDFYIMANKIYFIKLDFPNSGKIYIYFLGANYFRINSVSDGAIQHNHLASELKVFNFQKFIGDGTTTEYTMEFSPGSSYALFVTIDNILLQPIGDYFVVSNILTINVSPILNAEILVRNLGFKTSMVEYIIPSESVTFDKLGELAVRTSKINNLAVTNEKIAESAVSFTKLNSSLLNDIFFFTLINSNYTILNTKSYKLLVDTSANSISVTLPESPAVGQIVEIVDYNNSFNEFTLTVIRNGKTIDSLEENSLFYKRGVHCCLVYKGNDDWKTIYYDSGKEFTGVEYALAVYVEALLTMSEIHYSYIYPCKNLFVYSVTPSNTNVTKHDTLSIVFTFAENSVSVLGSNILPKITLLLSDLYTTKDAFLSANTDSTLTFSYTLELGLFSEGIVIQSYHPGDYNVTINNENFLVNELYQDINFDFSGVRNVLYSSINTSGNFIFDSSIKTSDSFIFGSSLKVNTKENIDSSIKTSDSYIFGSSLKVNTKENINSSVKVNNKENIDSTINTSGNFIFDSLIKTSDSFIFGSSVRANNKEDIDSSIKTSNSSISNLDFNYVFNITPSAASVAVGQTLSITVTSASNSMIISGSGTQPKMVLRLSGGSTKDAVLNEATSTTSTLVFDYTVQAATTSTGLTIQSFEKGGKTVTCNSFEYKCKEFPLAVNFTLT